MLRSRAFIREAEQDDELPVPSPTYLLQELYEEHAGAATKTSSVLLEHRWHGCLNTHDLVAAGPPIHHFDMYRLDSSQNVERLNLAQSFKTAVSLVEWADRLQQLPPERLDVHITILDTHDKVSYMLCSACSIVTSSRISTTKHSCTGHVLHRFEFALFHTEWSHVTSRLSCQSPQLRCQ